MKTKWLKVTALLLVMSLAGSALSDTVWTGAGLDDEWDNPFNWDTGVPPTIGSGATWLQEAQDPG